MTVVTFTGYTPAPRFDGLPWTKARVEEAPEAAGAWVEKETFDLDPVDTDPRYPMSRNFTLATAEFIEGWYRFIWEDGDGNDSQPTVPVHNVPDVGQSYMPSVDQIGALLRHRTVDRVGDEKGTFTADTRPTHAQAEELIEQAEDDVMGQFGETIPELAWPHAQSAIALKAAMLIETSFFGEQIAANRSVYPVLESQFKDVMSRLTEAVERERAEEEDEEEDPGGPGLGMHNFPENEGGMIGWGTRW